MNSSLPNTIFNIYSERIKSRIKSVSSNLRSIVSKILQSTKNNSELSDNRDFVSFLIYNAPPLKWDEKLREECLNEIQRLKSSVIINDDLEHDQFLPFMVNIVNIVL